MEPKGPLPHSQVSATSPCPEPGQSSLCSIPLYGDPSSYYPSINPWVFQMISYPHLSPSKRYIHLSSPHMCYITAHFIFLDFITRIRFGKQYISLSSSLGSFLISPITSSLLGPNILRNTLFSNTLRLRSSLNVRDQISQPYTTTCSIP